MYRIQNNEFNEQYNKATFKSDRTKNSQKNDNEVSRLQSGFRTGSGTREGIFNLRTVCEQATDLGKDAYICFIDYTKAFDRVKHSKIIECLSEIGIDDKDLQIITKIYWEQTAMVRTEHKERCKAGMWFITKCI